MAKAKKHVLKTDSEKKQEVIGYILDFFEKSDEINPRDYHFLQDKNEDADIVGYLFVNRMVIHLWNQEGFTPYEEKKSEKLVKLFFIDISPEIEWNKTLTADQQHFLDKKRICTEAGIIYIVGDEPDKIIDEVLKLK